LTVRSRAAAAPAPPGHPVPVGPACGLWRRSPHVGEWGRRRAPPWPLFGWGRACL